MLIVCAMRTQKPTGIPFAVFRVTETQERLPELTAVSDWIDPYDWIQTRLTHPNQAAHRKLTCWSWIEMQPRSKSSHFTFLYIRWHAVTPVFNLFQSCHSMESLRAAH